MLCPEELLRMCKQIYEFLINNKMISDWQSGFRPLHSCTTSVIDVARTIQKSIDHSKISFLLLLDHSKAFHSVN